MLTVVWYRGSGRLFGEMDTDNDELVSLDEFCDGLHHVSTPPLGGVGGR